MLSEADRQVVRELVRDELAHELRDLNDRLAASVATLRVEQSRATADLHTRIDTVHTLALRKLTELLERRLPE